MSSAAASRRLTDWFRQWRAPLRKFLQGHGAVSGADVNDVAQEVFLRLLRYDRVELIEFPQAYLFKMAANVANEWAIRARSRRPHDSRWLSGLLAEDSPEDDASCAEARAEVDRALATLTPRQRTVLALQFGEGMSRTQIAQHLGTSERIIKRDLVKSYETLRTELDTDLLRVLSHERE